MTKAECVFKSYDHLGEGIIWDEIEQCVFWLDVPMPSKLHRWYPDSGKYQSWEMPEMITSMSVKENRGLLVASHYGLNDFNFENGELEQIIELEKEYPNNRCNDGASDRKGRFWFGTMGNNISSDAKNIESNQSSGSIYRYDTDKSLHTMKTDIGCPNTFVWSPDNSKMYFTDTLTGWISEFEYQHEEGLINNAKEFAFSERGYPDGSTIDSDGGVWNCRWGGGCVIRFTPNGKIDQIVEVPVPNVTSCTFGGDNMDTLFITTARWDMSPNQLSKNPYAGCVFASKPGVIGIPDSYYKG